MRTSRHIGKWSITALVAMALAALVLMASCQEPASQVPGSASITVHVADATDSKTITPSGGVDVSHYRVTIDNVAEDVHMTSGHLEKDTSFTANNVPAGMWTATVDAYVKNGDAGMDSDYVHVATATSAETRVVAGEQAVLTVMLDSLLDSLSGSISVTLLLPSELDDEGTPFWYSYSIRGTGQRSGVSISHDERMPARTGADGACTIPISDPLEQGSYLLTLKVFDSADASTTFVERTGVEVMRLLPGLEASGTVNLDSQVISEEGFSIDITDTTGDLLVPRTEDGEILYEIDATGTLTPFTITLSEPVPAGFVLQWYVDGDETEAESTDDRSFTMSIAKGMHSVIGIMRDDAASMSVGSVVFDIEVKAAVEITSPFQTFAWPDFSMTDVDDNTNVRDTITPVVSDFETALLAADIYSSSTVSVQEGEMGFSDVDRWKDLVEDFASVLRTAGGYNNYYNGPVLSSYAYSFEDFLIETFGNGFMPMKDVDLISLPPSFSQWVPLIRLESDQRTIAIKPDEAAVLGKGHEFAFELDEANPSFRLVDGALYTADMTTLVSVPKGRDTFRVADGVTRIAPAAFLLDTTIREVDLNDVLEIGDGAFAFCYSLEHCDLSNIEKLGRASFAFCYSLQEMNLSSSIQEIPDYCFAATYSLVMVRLPENIRDIGSGAFANLVWDRTSDYPKPRTVIFETGYEQVSAAMIPVGISSNLPFQWNRLERIVLKDLSSLLLLGSANLGFISEEDVPEIYFMGDMTPIRICSSTSYSYPPSGLPFHLLYPLQGAWAPRIWFAESVQDTWTIISAMESERSIAQFREEYQEFVVKAMAYKYLLEQVLSSDLEYDGHMTSPGIPFYYSIFGSFWRYSSILEGYGLNVLKDEAKPSLLFESDGNEMLEMMKGMSSQYPSTVVDPIPVERIEQILKEELEDFDVDLDVALDEIAEYVQYLIPEQMTLSFDYSRMFNVEFDVPAPGWL